MKKSLQHIASVALFSLLAIMVGCGTTAPLGNSNPELGYIHCKMMLSSGEKIDSARFLGQIKDYQKAIAANHLKRFLDTQPGRANLRVDAWKAYVDSLSSRITLEERGWLPDSKVLNKEEQAKLVHFWKQNQADLAFSGAEVSSEWKTALSDAKDRLTELNRQKKELMQRIVKDIEGCEYATALQEIVRLKAFCDIGDLEVNTRDEAAEFWQQEIRDNLAAVKGMEADVREATLQAIYDKINYYKATCGLDVGFKSLSDETIRSLADCWKSRIAAMAQQGNYWDAYLFMLGCMDQAQKSFAPHRDTLVKQVAEGYALTLDGAMQHYVELARREFEGGFYGVSFIYCGMALEMHDTALGAGVEPGRDARKWGQVVQSLISDIDARAAERFARRLIICDFDTDQRGLAMKVRSEALAAYQTPDNRLVWGLRVDTKIEDRHDVGTLKANDCVVAGVVTDYSVERLNDVLTPAQQYDRRSDSMQRIANPNYKKKGLPYSDSELIWQQRIDLYPVSLVDCRKKVTADVATVCKNGSGASSELFVLRKALDEKDLKSKVHVSFKQYGQPSPSPQFKLHPEKSQLVVDEIPRNARIDLASDSEILRELDGLVIEGILSRLDQRLGRFPLEILSSRPEGNASVKEKCDGCGLALLYCEKLSAPDMQFSSARLKEMLWSPRLKVTENNIARWVLGRWADESEAAKKEMSSLWDTGTGYALQLSGK
ncbi:MAG: hypothetical protein JXR25_03685 [Pontiellaceae bacterium]|nr:hypothetical protein [Pontiellaceae bacterium]